MPIKASGYDGNLFGSSPFSAMDEHELARRSSSSLFSPHQSPAFFSGAGGQHPVLEFQYRDVPEQWLQDDDDDDNSWVVKLWDDDGTATAFGNGATPSAPPPPPPPAPSGNDDVSDSDKLPAPAPPQWRRRRGRKPGSRTSGGPVVSHVEAERQRRDRLNRRFCELRAAVPTVSKMDRASLLADAAAYIAELRARAERLEIEVKQQQAAAAAAAPSRSAAAVVTAPRQQQEAFEDEKLEVRMLGQRDAAALRLTTTTAASATPHAAARLMAALSALDLPVQHACVCRVGGATTVQDAVVVDVPVALQDEGCLREALLQSLQGNG